MCSALPPLLLQAYVRGLLARSQTRELRQQKAATNIQTAWRRYKMRQQYNMVLHNITAVQVSTQQQARWTMATGLATQPT